MRNRKWQELDPRVRHAIVAAAAFEAGLKVAAFIDLAQRPRASIRGSKAAWAAALTVVNSVGAVPVLYFLRGRRQQ